MPRAGLSAARVVQAGAELADELGYANLTLLRIADRLGVSPPSLYKHVASLADVQHQVATLAMSEMGEKVRDAMVGKSQRDALAAFVRVAQDYVTAHPGRYSSTVGAELGGPEDPLVQAGARVIGSLAAMLAGYGVPDDEMVHAIRTIRCAVHGYAMLQATNGFQWSPGPEESLDWMISFLDRGLQGLHGPVRTEAKQ
jgi:AcrR family transcriptional regulator